MLRGRNTADGQASKERPSDRGIDERQVDGLTVRVVRSERRHRTISGRLIDDHTLEVRAPEGLATADLEAAIATLVKRFNDKRARQRVFRSDATLQARAERLNRAYFTGALVWQSIRFVSNQRRRFGSCTPARGTIRISDRLAQAPDFVLDYVVMHELTHLIEPGHSKRFWEIVYRYDKTERARGYLMALALEDGKEPRD